MVRSLKETASILLLTIRIQHHRQADEILVCFPCQTIVLDISVFPTVIPVPYYILELYGSPQIVVSLVKLPDVHFYLAS